MGKTFNLTEIHYYHYQFRADNINVLYASKQAQQQPNCIKLVRDEAKADATKIALMPLKVHCNCRGHSHFK